MKLTALLLLMNLAAGVVYAQTSPQEIKNMNKDVIAEVLGKKITVENKNDFDGLIINALLEQFEMENNLKPTAEELDTFIMKQEEREKQHQLQFEKQKSRLLTKLKVNTLSEQERKEKESELQTTESYLMSAQMNKEKWKGQEEQIRIITRDLAQKFVKMWKINKALYAKYGGRVIFQQVGAEPVDAYRDFLKEQEKKGAFQFIDKTYEASFWRYFTNDAIHSFYKKAEGARFINTPWWMMEQPPEE
jgi:hypothetical protein